MMEFFCGSGFNSGNFVKFLVFILYPEFVPFLLKSINNNKKLDEGKERRSETYRREREQKHERKKWIIKFDMGREMGWDTEKETYGQGHGHVRAHGMDMGMGMDMDIGMCWSV
jgi:hypothetical protein